ncbi:MAG: hypothetical protein KGD63_12750 [Candidatus Lokiarchaeota archaeon]|nr:hypothetical protein [Candidatus Lokiarchaeota archaeon]
MAIIKKYAYCKKCGKPVTKPKKKTLESFHYQILVIAIIASLGIGLLVFIIYRKFVEKKKHCPDCSNEVQFYKNAKDVPGPKVPVINLLEKLEENKEIEEPKSDTSRKFVNCENCEKEFDDDATICPFCGWHHETIE